MKIEFVTRGYFAKDRLKDLIEKKVSKLEKYFDDDVSAKVVMSASGKDRYKMEITIKSAKKVVRSEVLSDNMFANIDTCLGRIERQTIKYFSKQTDLKRKKIDNDFAFIDELPEIVAPKIAKEKHYELVPMSVDEAIDNLELLGNTFYIFVNNETNAVAVVYKRDDGGFGLINTSY